jgi:uncharacterized membrane protein YoaK (UPF0700 family)
LRVRLGVFVGDGDWSFAAQRLVPIIVFTLGVAGGVALIEALRRRSAPSPAARVLSVEAGLLLAFMLVGQAVLDGNGASGGSWDYYLLTVIVVLAMGLQNAALRRVAGVPIHTTFVTGILTHLAEEAVNGWYAWRDARRTGTSDRDDAARTAFRRARLYGGVWFSYLGGGVLGALLVLRWDLWVLALPLAALALLSRSRRRAADTGCRRGRCNCRKHRGVAHFNQRAAPRTRPRWQASSWPCGPRRERPGCPYGCVAHTAEHLRCR